MDCENCPHGKATYHRIWTHLGRYEDLCSECAQVHAVSRYGKPIHDDDVVVVVLGPTLAEWRNLQHP